MTRTSFDYQTYGIDIDKSLNLDYSIPIGFVSLRQDFLIWDGIDRHKGLDEPRVVKPQLVLCNPPFNGYGNKLGSEVWLDKIIELFGKEVPIVLFAPMGFRLNGKQNGKRWSKFNSDKYPPISSIISLPRDIFPEVEFHSERLYSNLQKTFNKGFQILIFNLQGLEPHYFFN